MDLLPIDGDEDHAEEGRRNVAVEEEGEEAAEGVAEDPRLVNVPRGRQGQIEGAKEEVGAGQAEHKGRRGVRPQLAAPQQRRHRQRVAYWIE